ncbi:hypothetical protein B0H19DRAFT_1066844 [Mycena capillaripes]|nr:hypothetical protein B0H19DRAFT_1066844 [Mycena capillaripes]
MQINVQGTQHSEKSSYYAHTTILEFEMKNPTRSHFKSLQVNLYDLEVKPSHASDSTRLDLNRLRKVDLVTSSSKSRQHYLEYCPPLHNPRQTPGYLGVPLSTLCLPMSTLVHTKIGRRMSTLIYLRLPPFYLRLPNVHSSRLPSATLVMPAWRQEKGWQGLDERQIELDPEEQEGGLTPLREGSPDTVAGEENDMGGGKKIYQPFDPQVRYIWGLACAHMSASEYHAHGGRDSTMGNIEESLYGRLQCLL